MAKPSGAAWNRNENMDTDSLVRPNIRILKPYHSARQDFLSGILLDANENSFGSTLPGVTPALNRYPDPSQRALREPAFRTQRRTRREYFCRCRFRRSDRHSYPCLLRTGTGFRSSSGTDLRHVPRRRFRFKMQKSVPACSRKIFRSTFRRQRKHSTLP